MKYRLTLEREDGERKSSIHAETCDMDQFDNFMLQKTYNIDVETEIIRKLYEELIMQLVKGE